LLLDLTTRHFLHRFLLICCLLATPSVAQEAGSNASPAATTLHDTWSVPGILGGGVKANDAYVDGSFFLTIPAYSSIGQDGRLAGDVIFIEPNTSWGEQGEVAVSLGVGWRHLFSGQSVSAVTQHDGHQAGFLEEGGFVGANLFVDMLDTQFDNRFWQLGFGVEAGTRYVEMRANYYVPLSDRKLAEEIRTRESFVTHSTLSGYEEPFGVGHTIQQDWTRTTFLTATTIERLFRRYEEGMEGWDAEFALLIPWVDRWMDVKVIGGYYSFDNQPFGPQTGGSGDVDGWKAGVEARPVPAVVLNATWYEDDHLTGSDWIAGVRLEIPFEAGDLGDGRGLWDRVGDAFRPRRRHLVERMAEPVRRQNAAINTFSSVEENKSATEVKVVTKVISQSRRRIVLADSVVFVDNAIGRSTNPGTYEAPLDTIQNGENTGNSAFGDSAIVMVQGRPDPYVGNVTITQGVRLFGSGSFFGLGGKAFHGRTNLQPHLSGGFVAQHISSTVGITGFEITRGLTGAPGGPVSLLGQPLANVGILFENVAHGVITRNHIHGIARGVHVESHGAGSRNEVLVSGNVISGNGDGIMLAVGHLGHLDGRVENNLISENTFGIFMFTGAAQTPTVLPFGGSGRFIVYGNTITGNLSGVEVAAILGSDAKVSLISNVITLNHLGLQAVGSNGDAEIFLSDNIISFNSLHQIFTNSVSPDGSLNFISTGALSNTVLETPGNPNRRYEAGSPMVGGSILINGHLHPAGSSLP
jgi:hypothetical protein